MLGEGFLFSSLALQQPHWQNKVQTTHYRNNKLKSDTSFLYHLTFGSYCSKSGNGTDFFTVDTENAARKCTFTDPTDDEPSIHMDGKKKASPATEHIYKEAVDSPTD